MNEYRFSFLLQRFKKNQLKSNEKNEFFQMLESGQYDNLVEESIKEALKNYKIHRRWNRRKEHQLLGGIHQQLGFIQEQHDDENMVVVPLYQRAWLRWSVAAVFLLLTIGTAYLSFEPEAKLEQTTTMKSAVITPGGNKAVLTLDDGRQLVLDEASNGALAQQGGVKIYKLDNNVLSYKAQTGSGKVTYNTLTTPRGGQFQVELPDGSRVWLNSASSLKYPTLFTGNSREVDLVGEAYFEITTDKTKAFKVNTSHVQVQVLGTGFNLTAYGDDYDSKTTLVHGSVQVDAGEQKLVIKPGQQASFEYSSNSMAISTPDMEEVLAWKDGKFRFNQTPVETIMRQVERWYDVDVLYKGDLSEIRLSGLVSRRENVEKLLEIFSATERLRFVKQGRKITVMPY